MAITETQQKTFERLVSEGQIRIAPVGSGLGKLPGGIFLTPEAQRFFEELEVPTLAIDPENMSPRLFNYDFAKSGVTAVVTADFPKLYRLFGDRTSFHQVMWKQMQRVDKLNPNLNAEDEAAQEMKLRMQRLIQHGHIRKIDTAEGLLFFADQKAHDQITSYTPFDNLNGVSTCFETPPTHEPEGFDFSEHPHQLKKGAMEILLGKDKMGEFEYDELVRAIPSVPAHGAVPGKL